MFPSPGTDPSPVVVSKLAARVKHIDGKLQLSKHLPTALSESLHTEGIQTQSAEFYLLSKGRLQGIKGIVEASSDALSSRQKTSKDNSLMQGFFTSDS